VSPDILNSVNAKFIRLESGLLDGVNLINRVEVLPSESGGTVSLDDEMPEEGGGDPMDDGPNGERNALVRSNTQWHTAIYAKVSGTGRRVTEMQNFMIAEFAVMKAQARRTEEIVRGMSYAPARRITRHVNLQGPPPVGNRINVGPPATLSRNPRTLECLWDEYCNGIGGAKPARDFNREERGRLKFKYSRRLIVWKCIERQLVGGCNLTTALMRIKSVYGDHSMSDTIKAMRKDERNGGHARLR